MSRREILFSEIKNIQTEVINAKKIPGFMYAYAYDNKPLILKVII